MKNISMGHIVFLGLGSNLGDRKGYLRAAIDAIGESAGEVVSISGIYESEPWGFSSEERFLNMVISLKTEPDPETLLKKLMKIESKLGRVRNGKGYSSRTIDIDILLYDDLIIDKPDLKIPHPLIQERRFVLAPLCDIAPDITHPVLKKTFAALLGECGDLSQVTRIN